MPDMLVKLYDLLELEPIVALQCAMGVTIRRAMPPEKFLVLDWIRQRFSSYWVSEADSLAGGLPPGAISFSFLICFRLVRPVRQARKLSLDLRL